jgi:hypothetical protein
MSYVLYVVLVFLFFLPASSFFLFFCGFCPFIATAFSFFDMILGTVVRRDAHAAVVLRNLADDTVAAGLECERHSLLN